jgi:hypothetical protein
MANTGLAGENPESHIKQALIRAIFRGVLSIIIMRRRILSARAFADRARKNKKIRLSAGRR